MVAPDCIIATADSSDHRSTTTGQVRAADSHGLIVRLTHGANAVVLGGLVWSGLLIDWADRPYQTDIGGIEVGLYPEVVYGLVRAPGRLAEGIAWHLTLVWLFAANAVLYLTRLVIGGSWRRLAVGRTDLAELRDLRRVLARPSGHGTDYHGAQRLAYASLLVIVSVTFASGVLVWKPVQFGAVVETAGGYQAMRLIHLAGSALIVAFVVVHLVQVGRAGRHRAAAMVTGFERLPVVPARPTEVEPS